MCCEEVVCDKVVPCKLTFTTCTKLEEFIWQEIVLKTMQDVTSQPCWLLRLFRVTFYLVLTLEKTSSEETLPFVLWKYFQSWVLLLWGSVYKSQNDSGFWSTLLFWQVPIPFLFLVRFLFLSLSLLVSACLCLCLCLLMSAYVCLWLFMAVYVCLCLFMEFCFTCLSRL